MRTLSTFSILFWVYTKRSKNNQAPIYARITVNKKKLNISLKRQVETRLWNNQKQRIKGTSEKARKINQYLDEVYTKLFQCYQELGSENKSITPQTIKSRYTGDDKIGRYTLRDIIEYHNTSMFEKLHGNTSRLYLTSQKYILLFVKKKYKVDDLELFSLDYKFVLNFENFLRNYSPRHYKKRIGNKAVMKHIQRLRRMVSLAHQLEWIDRDPFVKFKQKLTPTHRGFLTPEELKRIEELQVKSTRLKLVKDLFVFSCYTGISYIDVMLLTNESLVPGLDKSNWIMTKRQKTRNQVKIPLLSKASEIIERYRHDKRSLINGTLFPRISNQKINAYLKEVANLAKVRKNLTFHMARHTFATTVTLTNGVPIETISKMLGHRKLTTTQIYVKVLEKKVCDDMQFLREKLEQS
ncbi:site-specific integrase [Flagellimonas meridianipacifica]|uniref:Site-specific recombinase XerD n=1 Tax=Flagellimonas meridianipacifica TaxID=1080225 RepID=A0A2T0MI21_9FLAO|nr:site-specific integrase [Allomuricauda pacifica]PRX57186.1 site-specific recombinase XerD [Allomuricauda pacifica]